MSRAIPQQHVYGSRQSPMMKLTKRQKRFVLIGAVLALSLVTALIVRTFDTPADGVDASLVPPRQTPTEATLEAFRVGGEQMAEGDFGGAIATYEDQLARLDEIPVGNMSSYFGDLGLAHYYQGQRVREQGLRDQANEHFLRAAFMFEQAADTATYGVITSVANYYQVLALYAAKEYALARTVGEAFLDMFPEAAVAADLLPAGAVAAVKEILSVSYMGLAESDEAGSKASVFRTNGLRYAEEAIQEAPERVIQPYLFTGLEAYRQGQRELAIGRLETFARLMQTIPEEHWDPEDRAAMAEAREALAALQ